MNIRTSLASALVAAGLAYAPTSASALMMENQYEQLEGGGGGYEGGGGGGTYTPPPQTYNKILYFTGSTQNKWPTQGFLAASSAWQHVNVHYWGDGKMSNSTVRTTIKNALINNCATSTPNQCVLIAGSAGGPRVLQGLDDAYAAGYDLRIAWQGHYASAEGGTELANKWTKGWRRIIAKVFGSHAPIADDLTTARMRNDYWYIHYSPRQAVYMLAGTKDETIKKFLFWKIKGNTHMPCKKGDGKVPVHSAGGYASIQCNYSMCDGNAKYPNRTAHSCSTVHKQHIDTIAEGVKLASTLLATTRYFAPCDFPEDTEGEEASTADDSADTAGQGGWHCEKAACMNGGLVECDYTAPPALNVDTCDDGYCDAYSSAYCGDYSCSGGETSYSCPTDCGYAGGGGGGYAGYETYAIP